MPCGADAVSFTFAQVGNDQKVRSSYRPPPSRPDMRQARAFLEEIDKDPMSA
jgi:hypothetical protein